MRVELLFNTPLWVASTAIRKCWASEDKSDTKFFHDSYDEYNEEVIYDEVSRGEHNEVEMGEADKALILRVGNKNKHASTLEHLNYSFDIDGISRACLQELARHRHASLSVKSTRYTLKELKAYELATDDTIIDKFLVRMEDARVVKANLKTLRTLQQALNAGLANDKAKYMLPEAYKTSLVWTVNARSLQNFLALRTNKAALWEIQKLANELFNNLPEEHKYLFEEFIND